MLTTKLDFNTNVAIYSMFHKMNMLYCQTEAETMRIEEYELH